MKKWFALQLSEKGESVLEEEPLVIENILHKFFGDKYFIPLHYNKSKAYFNKIFLFKGYIFVEYCDSFLPFLDKISMTHYFVGPLTMGDQLQYVSNDEIKRLKKQLHKISKPIIKVGDKVRVIDGKYKNLEAVAMACNTNNEEVDISIDLKCISIIVPEIPISCLRNITKEDKKKQSLEGRVLLLLKENPDGFSRKSLIEKMDLKESEKKRLSTCLSRAVKKNIIKSLVNDSNKTIFVYNFLI